MTRIFLDDLRDPYYVNWTWDECIVIRNFLDFKKYIERNGCPDIISFDHDLGKFEGQDEKTGYDCAKLLVDMDLNNLINITNLSFQVHSANPVGKQNIEGLLVRYISFKS